MSLTGNIRIATNYTVFAVVATIANIGLQDISLRLYDGPYSFPASVLAGTILGLFVKYALDKRYIFRFEAKGTAHNTQTFVLYTVTGIVTTGIFWGFEFAFNDLFETRGMRYLGGTIGLAIGYFIKYRLDKRFVFSPRARGFV